MPCFKYIETSLKIEKIPFFLSFFYQNSLEGLVDEVIKKLWTIIDLSKTDEKEKMNAINLIMHCYKERFEMIKSEPELIIQKVIR